MKVDFVGFVLGCLGMWAFYGLYLWFFLVFIRKKQEQAFRSYWILWNGRPNRHGMTELDVCSYVDDVMDYLKFFAFWGEVSILCYQTLALIDYLAEGGIIEIDKGSILMIILSVCTFLSGFLCFSGSWVALAKTFLGERLIRYQ